MATRAAAHGKGEVRKELNTRVHMWKQQEVPVHGRGTLTSWRWVQTGQIAPELEQQAKKPKLEAIPNPDVTPLPTRPLSHRALQAQAQSQQGGSHGLPHDARPATSGATFSTAQIASQHTLPTGAQDLTVATGSPAAMRDPAGAAQAPAYRAQGGAAAITAAQMSPASSGAPRPRSASLRIKRATSTAAVAGADADADIAADAAPAAQPTAATAGTQAAAPAKVNPVPMFNFGRPAVAPAAGAAAAGAAAGTAAQGEEGQKSAAASPSPAKKPVAAPKFTFG